MHWTWRWPPVTERASIAVLAGYRASTSWSPPRVMTAGAPQRYTVIDFRALWSLGINRRGYYSVTLYLGYLAVCRALAAGAGVHLRTLDQTLRPYSEANQRSGG